MKIFKEERIFLLNKIIIFGFLTMIILVKSGSTLYYDEADFCNMPDGYFDFVALCNYTTDQTIIGNKDGDVIYLIFRPYQLFNLSTNTFTYEFGYKLLNDLIFLLRNFNASFYIDIPYLTTTPLKYICGADFNNNKTYYGSPNFSSNYLTCEAPLDFTRTMVNDRMSKIRIVQEGLQRVAIYGVYPDMMVKIAYSSIHRLGHLIFDFKNVDLKSIIYLHLVNLVIKNCQPDIIDPIPKYYKLIFNTRLVLHFSQLCKLVDKKGYYNYVDHNGHIWNDIFLDPAFSDDSSFRKTVSMFFWSNYKRESLGGLHILVLFKINHESVKRALGQWRNFVLNASHSYVEFNQMKNANCTAELLNLRGEHVTLIFMKNETVEIEIQGTTLEILIKLPDVVTYSINYNYILSKVICESYDNQTKNLFSISNNYSLFIKRYMQHC